MMWSPGCEVCIRCKHNMKITTKECQINISLVSKSVLFIFQVLKGFLDLSCFPAVTRSSCRNRRKCQWYYGRKPIENHLTTTTKQLKSYAPINVRDLIDRFGLGVGHLNYLAVPGLGIFEFFSCPWLQIISRGGEFQLYLTWRFCLG